VGCPVAGDEISAAQSKKKPACVLCIFNSTGPKNVHAPDLPTLPGVHQRRLLRSTPWKHGVLISPIDLPGHTAFELLGPNDADVVNAVGWLVNPRRHHLERNNQDRRMRKWSDAEFGCSVPIMDSARANVPGGDGSRRPLTGHSPVACLLLDRIRAGDFLDSGD
jgi:hypothetical protein